MKLSDENIFPVQKNHSLPKITFPSLNHSLSTMNHSRAPVTREIQSEKFLLPSINPLSVCSSLSKLSYFNQTKCSDIRNGAVFGFAVNLHLGSGRHRKEDRVKVIAKLEKPLNFSEAWPKSSFFGLYNGNYGKGCARYLRDHLHNNIINDIDFPLKIKKACLEGFLKTDSSFLKAAEEEGDISGACALTAFIIGNMCIIANTGSSKAILSYQKGKKIKSLVKQHLPSDPEEQSRISGSGGTVKNDYFFNEKKEIVLTSSARVNPGKLKVSRAFGNLDAKSEKYGGNPKVVIAEPSIKSFKIRDDFDFLFISTSSLFEYFTEENVVKMIWDRLSDSENESFGFRISAAVDYLLAEFDIKGVSENLTCMLIAFRNIKQ